MNSDNSLLAVKGIYDGNSVRLLGKGPTKKRYRVVITFVEELDEKEDLRTFANQTEGLSFWEDDREDLYEDFIAKSKR